MRRSILWAAALAAGLALPAAAVASPGFVTTDLNLRAGPSTGFPVVDTIPEGARVNIHGCLSDYAWCDVSWSGERGWAASDYLQSLYDGRRVLIVDYGDVIGFPIVTFDIGTYWGHHYRHRPFYSRMSFWRQRYAHDYRRHRHHARDTVQRRAVHEGRRDRHRARGAVERRAIVGSPAGRATAGAEHIGRRGHRAHIAGPTGRHHRGAVSTQRAAPRAGHVARGVRGGPGHFAGHGRATTGAAVGTPRLHIGGGGRPHAGGHPGGGHGGGRPGEGGHGGGHGGPHHR